MSREFELPARILQVQLDSLRTDRETVNRQIGPLTNRRDQMDVDISILENAIESLRERAGADPEVEYDPADGEADSKVFETPAPRMSLKHPHKDGPLLVEGHTYQLNCTGHRWDKRMVRLQRVIDSTNVVISSHGEESSVHPSDLA